MKIVIFDGPNGSGKTTLRYSVFNKLFYNVLTIDRFTPSIWVYDGLRGIDRIDSLEFEEKVDALQPLVVLCTCDPKIAESRVRKSDLREVEFPINQQVEMFNKYFNVSRYSKKIIIDTGKLSITDSVNKIIESI